MGHWRKTGGLEAETEARYGREGIPLNDATLSALAHTAGRLGVAASNIG